MKRLQEGEGVAGTKRHLSLEGAVAKSAQLRAEGASLAEEGCYLEALCCWEHALSLSPACAALHEMKAQVSPLLASVLLSHAPPPPPPMARP